MLRFLRWFVHFIETRFPEKVTITKEDFFDLKSHVHELSVQLDSAMRSEEHMLLAISAIDKSVAALKEGIIKGEIKPVLDNRERERREFIEGRFPIRPNVTRQEIEQANTLKK